MRRHIVCLGDSNTHGYCSDPTDCADGALGRFNEDERWPCLLQKALGEDYLIIEEGLSGRTTVFDDPVHEGYSALPYLYPCLMSHEPVDLLIIMLGTNDTKDRFSANPHVIAQGMRRLVRKAKATECWGPAGRPNILVIAPVPIGEGALTSHVAEEMGPGCVEKSRSLAAVYRTMAAEEGVHFLDAAGAGCACNTTVDFMHLTRAGHARLAAALAELVPTLV